MIAQNITNLTDARYFAAWGVNYISFNIIQNSDFYINEADIKEIKEWVEGPQILLETNALEFDELADGFILDNIYSSLPIVKESFFRTSLSEIQKGLPAGKYIIDVQPDEIDILNDLETGHLDLYINIQNLTIDQIADLSEYGLVVQGGEEEKVGVKSFDELDEVYEYLMD